MKDREEITQEKRTEKVTLRVPESTANAFDVKNNSEYQRRQGMSQGERSREAVEKMARDIKEHNERQGKHVSHEEAHRAAEHIANIADRKLGR